MHVCAGSIPRATLKTLRAVRSLDDGEEIPLPSLQLPPPTALPSSPMHFDLLHLAGLVYARGARARTRTAEQRYKSWKV